MLPVSECCNIRSLGPPAPASCSLITPGRRPRRLAARLVGTGALLWAACPAVGEAPPSETPAAFSARADTFDYTQREVMIPMRDGVKLQTVILIPRGAHGAPILLSRTPYGATERISKNNSAHLAALIDSTDVADDAVESGGYIRVVQDVRGKYGSEGDYVMNRPVNGPLNPTPSTTPPIPTTPSNGSSRTFRRAMAKSARWASRMTVSSRLWRWSTHIRR